MLRYSSSQIYHLILCRSAGMYVYQIATLTLTFNLQFYLQLTTAGMKRLLIAIYMSIFSLITPLGIGIGMGISASAASNSVQSPTVTVLQGLAAGTLVYVVFFEVLEKERAKKSNGLAQVISL